MKKKLSVVLICVFWGLNIFSQNHVNKDIIRDAPEWISHGIIYQMPLRSFTVEGTLSAATKKLPGIAELGATIVYLCPIMLSDTCTNKEGWSPRQIASKMNNPRSPYRIMDYTKVDPEYGTEKDLKEFVKTAHYLGLRVIIDLVYHSTGPNNVLMQYPEYYKRDENGNITKNQWGFYELNHKNESLREFLLNNMVDWIKKYDIDGWRCDVSGRVPLDFWEEARDRMEKIKPVIIMLAEAHSPYDQVKAFDISYGDHHITWFPSLEDVFVNGQPVVKLKEFWEKQNSKFPKGASYIRCIDSHDSANDDYHNRREKRWGFDGIQAALVYIFTLDGVPFVYNGQEIADTARHSIFGRTPIDWANAETLAGKKRFDFVQKLCKIRKNEKALTSGNLVWLDNDQPESVISYLREFNNEQIITVINLAKNPLKVNIYGLKEENSSFTTLITEFNKGDLKAGFDMKGYGFWVGKR